MPINLDPAPVRQPVIDPNSKTGTLSAIWQKWFSAVQTNLGLGLIASNNLSDLPNTATARSNLGLTGAATMALPVAISNGGTGASTLADAQTNLGITSILNAALTTATNTFPLQQILEAGLTSGGPSSRMDIDTGVTGTDARITIAGSTNAANGIYLDSPSTINMRDLAGNVVLQVTPSAVNINKTVGGSFGSWQSYSPVITASGSMTVSAVTVSGEYIVIGPLTYFTIHATFTLGGTLSNQVYITLPSLPVDSNFTFAIRNSSGSTNGFLVLSDTTHYTLFTSTTGLNFAAGSDSFICSGFYRNI